MSFETTRLGGVVSGASSEMTVTVKLAVPVLPAASDAVQVTVVVPTEKLEPEDGEQVGPEVTPTLSVAVTVNVTVLPSELEVETDRLDGTFTVGEVGSGKMTVTIKLATPTFPSLSIAVHVIVLVPIGRSVSYAGEQLLESILPVMFPLLSHIGRE
jgi:hypothetical protein